MSIKHIALCGHPNCMYSVINGSNYCSQHRHLTAIGNIYCNNCNTTYSAKNACKCGLCYGGHTHTASTELLSGGRQTRVYIGGALANPDIVRLTKVLLDAGFAAFSEWYTPGKEADVLWRDYELALGFDYRQALQRPSAKNTFNFDKRHIDESDVFVMLLPCGKSAHLELGYAIGTGKRGLIYMPEQPDRWDVMYGFAEAVVYTDKELLEALKP